MKLSKPFYSLCLFFSLCIAFPCFSQTKPIKVSVDPRMELLGIVQSLSDYGDRFGLITRHDFPYMREIKKRFSPFKQHQAVKLFTKMSHNSFSFDAPPAAMLYLSNPPELKQQIPFTEYLTRRAGNPQLLNQFVEALGDFANETEFMEFFKAHQEWFISLEKDVRAHLEGKDYVKTLEAYCGMGQRSYNIILAPLFVGNFGPRVKVNENEYDIYCINGPFSVKGGQLKFGTAESFRHLAWHEWGHSFVNPTTAMFRDEFEECVSLFEPIKEKMAQQAYPRWEVCVNEHIVRAITTRLSALNQGEAKGQSDLQHEKGRGFAYVEALCESLKIFENQRKTYPTLVDYYPELIKVLKRLSEQDLGPEFYAIPFYGTIGGALADKKSAIIILPTNEADKDLQKKLHEYVKGIHKRFYKTAPLITDQDALKKDLSAHTVVVYGTPNGNLWLKKHIKNIPVSIEPNRIVVNKPYSGHSLRLITAWPNPENRKRALVIYTAQRTEDVININSVFHGPTDYLIARGDQVLFSGDYVKGKGQWSIPNR